MRGRVASVRNSAEQVCVGLRQDVGASDGLMTDDGGDGLCRRFLDRTILLSGASAQERVSLARVMLIAEQHLGGVARIGASWARNMWAISTFGFVLVDAH